MEGRTRIKLAASTSEQQQRSEELQRSMTGHMYWVSISGSPHDKALRKSVEHFHFQAEFTFLLEQMWLDR
jgi:hypothetical protein